MNVRLLLLAGLFLCFSSASPADSSGWVLRPAGEVTGRYLVRFVALQDTASRLRARGVDAMQGLRSGQQQNIDRLRNDLGDTDLRILRNLWVRQSVAIALDSAFLPRLQVLSYVAEVRPDQRYQAAMQGVVTLPTAGDLVQDNLARIDIDVPWSESYRGQGVVIAVIDSGVDVQHADLETRWRGGLFDWFDPYGEKATPGDNTGHGTGVASLVVGGNATGSGIGVAPNAQWIAARIFDNKGDSTESAISAALQWVLDPDGNPATADYPQIVQNSWSIVSTEGDCNLTFHSEIEAIDALGIDQVFAVGNSGSSGLSSYLTPAFESKVISVGAIRSDDVLLFASSHGPNLCYNVVTPSLVAPGDNVKTANLSFNGAAPNNFTANTGTSFSAPLVSGALAILRSKFVAPDYLQYRNALFDTAEMLGSQDDYGRGVIQVGSAMAALAADAVPLRSSQVYFATPEYRIDETEAGAEVMLIRSGNLSSAVSVDISSSDGTATSPDDYDTISTTVNFAAGEYSRTVALTLFDDDANEGDESFVLSLSNNVNIGLGARASVVVTIVDDEAAEEEELIGGTSVGLFELAAMGLLLLARGQRA